MLVQTLQSLYTMVYSSCNFSGISKDTMNFEAYRGLGVSVTKEYQCQIMCQLCPFVTGGQHTLTKFVLQALKKEKNKGGIHLTSKIITASG